MSTETAMTICTLRRVDRRLELILRRMSSSSRTESASAPSRSRRPGPRSRELMISAAMIMSALESSRSSANRRSATCIGTRVCSRSTSRVSGSRIEASATRVEAGMACSSPTAPAIVSRSNSVQVARPSSRAMALRSEAAPLSERQL